MPPVIIWVLAAVGATVLVKFLVREARRINAELHPQTPLRDDAEMVHTLKRDPVSGVYRPSRPN